MGFDYRVLLILKAIHLIFFFVWNHYFFEKENNFRNAPENFTMFMHIAPSSDHSLLTLNLPFNVILRKFEIVSRCLEWEWCTFQKIDENSFKSTNPILWL